MEKLELLDITNEEYELMKSFDYDEELKQEQNGEENDR